MSDRITRLHRPTPSRLGRVSPDPTGAAAYLPFLGCETIQTLKTNLKTDETALSHRAEHNGVGLQRNRPQERGPEPV